MDFLEILEKLVSIVCPIVSVIISAIALFKSNYAVKQVNKIKIRKIEQKQEASNNKNSTINQSIK